MSGGSLHRADPRQTGRKNRLQQRGHTPRKKYLHAPPAWPAAAESLNGRCRSARLARRRSSTVHTNAPPGAFAGACNRSSQTARVNVPGRTPNSCAAAFVPMSDIIVSSESVRDWYMLKKRATPKPYPSIIRGENASKKRADAALTVFRHDLTNGSSGTKKTFTKLSRNRLNLNHLPVVPASTITRCMARTAT